MIKATTSSGAVYLIDIKKKMFCRQAAHPVDTNRGDFYPRGWVKYYNVPEIVPDSKLYFEVGNDDDFLSSVVTSVEDVEDPVLDSW